MAMSPVEVTSYCPKESPDMFPTVLNMFATSPRHVDVARLLREKGDYLDQKLRLVRVTSYWLEKSQKLVALVPKHALCKFR